ncbi:DUF1049 domain-containing protein [Nitrosomonas aestuarii]|uniref:Lipopolysaccharide assembly protein A domain-containing protein n=1 Tax=Nitrosomonas aestuarii TaxID=52441 RepID=A0A1I4CLN7_9PROT|nr:DUF1049 domain-containing protein [Nitrosomonas aestuarii]PTN09442.1 hypothetical protein C8R11_12329 [Nitrosomonas aestuarii]SFK80871.1 hypothetical protein SAMN05216302_101616 [Nitrosomonas aestuarii]
MQLIIWLLRLIVFVFLVGFAAINLENTTLFYYQNQSLELPLSVLLLIFFALGVMLTILTTPRKTDAKK